MAVNCNRTLQHTCQKLQYHRLNIYFSLIPLLLLHICVLLNLLNRCSFTKGITTIYLAAETWECCFLIGWMEHMITGVRLTVSCRPAFLRREELGRLWQLGKHYNFKFTGKQRNSTTTDNSDFPLQHIHSFAWHNPEDFLFFCRWMEVKLRAGSWHSFLWSTVQPPLTVQRSRSS